MSLAIMVHKEANGVDGGTLNPGGIVVSDTFHPRKLNALLVNQFPCVDSFDPVAFTFTLAPGTFRIQVSALFNSGANTASFGFHLGLFNITTGAFEVYTGGSEAILSTSAFETSGGFAGNRVVRLAGHFAVSATNKTYQLRHKTNGGLWAAAPTACGMDDQMSGANVNTAAASQFFTIVKLGRES